MFDESSIKPRNYTYATMQLAKPIIFDYVKSSSNFNKCIATMCAQQQYDFLYASDLGQFEIDLLEQF